jgi:hypothetical protein
VNPRQVHDAIVKRLADEGKIIAGGFAALRLAIVPADASAAQVNDLRIAYFAGAQHLYASMMATLDPGDDPTPADLQRMSLIDAELRAFAQEMQLRTAPTGAAS